MNKVVSYIIMTTLIIKFLIPHSMVWEVFAVTDTYDFNDDSVFTISNTDAAYIHWWSAKLKWSLNHRGHLENGPEAFDWWANIIVDWNYAYTASYWWHAVTAVDISNPTNLSIAWYIGADSTTRLWWAYDLKKVWNYIYVASYIDATNPTNLQRVWRFVDTGTSRLNGIRWIDVVWDFAYLAAYNDDALQIIDISNPSSPVERWNLRTTTASWTLHRLNGGTSVKVSWDYAYVTSFIHDSVQVIDISNPNNPSFVDQLEDDAITELDGTWGIEIVWNYAYVTGYNDDGLEIIDISDPSNITHVEEIQNSDPWIILNGARELRIEWDYAYITASSDDSVEIVDISDPINPKHIGVLDTTSYGELDWVFGISIFKNTVFVNSYNNASMFSIDVWDPTNPQFMWKIFSGPTRLWNPIGIQVDWDYAYIASYGSNSLEIVNISDSSNPTHAGVISDVSINNELFWSWDVIKSWDYVYVSAYGDRWLETVDVSNPVNPISTSSIIDSTTVELQNPRWSYIEWNYLYIVGYYWDSLQIFDISTPSTPLAVWNYKDSSVLWTPNDVVVKWNYAFITDYIRDKVVVIDVSDKTNPVYETEISDQTGLELNGVWDLRVDGDYLYIASYIDNAVVIIDISDPTNPMYRWDFDDTNSTRLNRPRGIVYDEWYAYLSTYSDHSVVTFDVSDPDEPLYIDEIRDTDLYFRSNGIDFNISDNNTNSTSTSVEFYIDEPEFTISTDTIDIWVVDTFNPKFSDSVTVTVKTVWAWFDVSMNTTTLPSYYWDDISSWNGITGYWYDLWPTYSWGISPMWINQNIASQTGSININGNKNIYIYELKLGSFVDTFQVWGDYEWKIDFGINLTY